MDATISNTIENEDKPVTATGSIDDAEQIPPPDDEAVPPDAITLYSSTESAALAYAARGWAVIPVYEIVNGGCACGDPECSKPGKHPRISDWVNAATTNPAQIAAWWERWPNANVGIATGKVSGIDVLDIDPRHGGEDSLQKLMEQIGESLPVTMEQYTGGGGRHLFFQHQEGLGNWVGCLPGIDIRTNGGCVVVAPSGHVSGNPYMWKKSRNPAVAEVAPWPTKLVDAIKQAHREKTAITGSVGMIPDGQRNDTLFNRARQMYQKGKSEEEVLDALTVINRDRCAPPMSDTEVVEIARNAIKYADGEGGDGKRTQSEWLTTYAREHCELWHTPARDAFATFRVEGHAETASVRSRKMREWLMRGHYTEVGRPPNGHVLQAVVDTLGAVAVYDGEEHEVYVRVAHHDGAIYVDLADDAWRAVEITGDGWRVVSVPPVRFRRPGGMLPLPEPVYGGSLDELKPYVNLDGSAWILALAWLVGTLLRPPYPLLVLRGEQGSAKSTTARALRGVIDPSKAPLRAPPKDQRDLVIAAENSWIIGLDNLSRIPVWFSDALCRLATGGGWSARQLYTDAEEIIIEATRPALLNGITDVIARDDLRDRSLIVNLPPIKDGRRRDENDLWSAYERVRPRILGALLDAVSCALRHHDDVQMPALPRLADFAMGVIAAEPALPWKEGEFMKAYDEMRAESVAAALEGDRVAIAVIDLMKDRDSWAGTATELLSVLKGPAPKATSNIYEKYANALAREKKAGPFPETPWALSNWLRRAVPALRHEGIEVEMDRREGKEGRRMIYISKMDSEEGRQPPQPEKEVDTDD